MEINFTNREINFTEILLNTLFPGLPSTPRLPLIPGELMPPSPASPLKENNIFS